MKLFAWFLAGVSLPILQQAIADTTPPRLSDQQIKQFADQATMDWKNWHRYFWQEIRATGASEGFALLSYGGWSNDGQILLFCGKSPRLTIVEPAGRKPEHKYEGADAACRDIAAIAGSWNALPRFDRGAADGLNYEWVHAKAQAGSWNASRVYMNNPSVDVASRHVALIKRMQSLRP